MEKCELVEKCKMDFLAICMGFEKEKYTSGQKGDMVKTETRQKWGGIDGIQI